jgi:hypothetical protein
METNLNEPLETVNVQSPEAEYSPQTISITVSLKCLKPMKSNGDSLV